VVQGHRGLPDQRDQLDPRVHRDLPGRWECRVPPALLDPQDHRANKVLRDLVALMGQQETLVVRVRPALRAPRVQEGLRVILALQGSRELMEPLGLQGPRGLLDRVETLALLVE